MPVKPKTKDSKPKPENNTVLLMTTAPPENGAWYLGKRLPPIGLMYVAAALEKAGFKVQMLDNYLMKKSTEEIKQLITQVNPEIVGITCGSATYPRCVETVKSHQAGEARLQDCGGRMACLLHARQLTG